MAAILPTRQQIHAELCRRKLRFFIEAAWAAVEPAKPFVPNWHIDVVCEILEAVERGEHDRVIFNFPPGTMKSLIVTVMFPAWLWARQPHLRFLTAAFIDVNTIRDNLRVRDIMMSEWYRTTFPHVQFRDDQNQKTKIATTSGGWRIATSVGGGGLGEHPDYTIIDDPIDPKKAVSDTQCDTVNNWFDGTIAIRGINRGVRQLVVMQRLQEKDLAGYLLKRGGWLHVCFPMRYDPEIASPHDLRTEPGQLLWPALFGEKSVATLELSLGTYNAAGQLQQRPVPIGGGIIKRDWFKYWKVLPGGATDWIQSWDCSFKDTDGSDFVCGGVWARHGANRYLVHRIKERLTLPGTCAAIRTMTAAYPQAETKLVEDKANGPAVIQTLRNEITGMIAFDPKGSKESRLHAVSPTIEAGNVYLPDPSFVPNTAWVEDYISELTNYPRAANDDQVDMTTQALLRYRHSDFGMPLEQLLNPPLTSADLEGLPAQF